MREGLPHRRGLGDVVAGLDLELDAHVPLVEVAAHDLDERRGVALDADRHPRRHAVAERAEILAERAVLGAQRGVEDGELDAGFRHAVALAGLQDPRDVLRGDAAPVEQGGDQPPHGDIPRALRVLARVQRGLARDDLAPSLAVGGERAHDDDLAHRLGAERRRERRHERDAQHPQFEPIEHDDIGLSGYGHALRLRPGGRASSSTHHAAACPGSRIGARPSRTAVSRESK